MFWWWCLFFVGAYVAVLGACNLIAWKEGLDPERLKTNAYGLALIIAFRWLFAASLLTSGLYVIGFSIFRP